MSNELELGEQLGRYRLIAELARGGMGIVYLASAHGPAGFSKLLALKQLRPELGEDAQFLNMFLDEARVAARLSHPNIVQTHDVGQTQGSYFIAMEYLDGRPFGRILKRFALKAGFPLPMGLSVVRDVLNALDYAHSFSLDGSAVGVVHRDISPQNIFVTFDGCTKVIDFGIAKALDSALETKTGVLKGKINYMAPEQLAHRAEPRSDVFSVGAVLFEVVTGRRVWDGLGEMEVLTRLARADIPAPDLAQHGVPPALARICQIALSPRAEDRFATAAAMRDALDEYLWASGARPQAREIGGCLAAEFGAERAETDALLKRAMSRPSWPIQPLHLGTPEPTGVSHRYAPPLPAAPRTNAHLVSSSSLQASLPSVYPSSAPSPFASVPHAAELGPSRMREVMVVVAAAMILMGVWIGFGLRGPAPASSTASVPQPAASAAIAPLPRVRDAALPAAAVPLPPPEDIVLSVSAVPATAQVIVDGQPVPANPFVARFPKDATTHRVRAVAPGFLPKERLVRFTDDVLVDLSLSQRPSPPPPVARRRLPLAARAVPQPAAPAPAPVPGAALPAPAAPPRAHATDIVPRAASEPALRRSIDPNSPYGEDQ
jgi:serine/threonine-protein kinase